MWGRRGAGGDQKVEEGPGRQCESHSGGVVSSNVLFQTNDLTAGDEFSLIALQVLQISYSLFERFDVFAINSDFLPSFWSDSDGTAFYLSSPCSSTCFFLHLISERRGMSFIFCGWCQKENLGVDKQRETKITGEKIWGYSEGKKRWAISTIWEKMLVIDNLLIGFYCFYCFFAHYFVVVFFGCTPPPVFAHWPPIPSTPRLGVRGVREPGRATNSLVRGAPPPMVRGCWAPGRWARGCGFKGGN